MASILDRCVQLITQSNDCCLMSDYEGRRAFRHMWDMAEYTKDPFHYVFIRPKGNAFTEEKLWENHYQNRIPKRPYKYHQKIRTIYITEAAFSYKEPYTFFTNDKGKRDLYLQFVSLKEKSDLADFIREKKDFCAFPDEPDFKFLQHRYAEKIGTEKYNFSHTMNDPFPEKIKREDNSTRKKIKRINLDYLWEKQNLLKNLVDLYKSGELNFLNLSAIHYYLEQSSEMFIDKKYYDIARIEKRLKWKYPKDNRTLDEILGDRKVDDSGQLVPAYRVYGHFALCCLQFYLLVKSQKSVDICQICQNYFKKEHKAEIFCDNCKGKAASNRSLKHQRKAKQ